MTTVFSRRRFATLSTSAAVLAAVPLSVRAKSAIDFADPVAGHRANVKLRGRLDNGWVWRVYWGEVYAAIAPSPAVPLFKLQGVIKAKWTDNGNGTHTELLYDVSAYTDWATGALLETFENPITKEPNKVAAVWDGPSQSTYTPTGRLFAGMTPQPGAKPVVLPWRLQSGRAWLAESASFERPHPLDPALWPKASSGKMTVSTINTSLSGELRDLESDTPSAQHDLQWTALRSWLPWLEMGQRPGFLLTIGTGRKINGPDELPAAALAVIEKHQPNFVSSEQPWTESLSSWERYKRLNGG